jgi:hypothetical protein
LEQQIYSIEAANINRETLLAMEKAGKAMADIHGNLSIDKVDDTMYVIFNRFGLRMVLTFCAGRSSASSMRWVRKLPMLSPVHL